MREALPEVAKGLEGRGGGDSVGGFLQRKRLNYHYEGMKHLTRRAPHTHLALCISLKKESGEAEERAGTQLLAVGAFAQHS